MHLQALFSKQGQCWESKWGSEVRIEKKAPNAIPPRLHLGWDVIDSPFTDRPSLTSCFPLPPPLVPVIGRTKKQLLSREGRQGWATKAVTPSVSERDEHPFATPQPHLVKTVHPVPIGVSHSLRLPTPACWVGTIALVNVLCCAKSLSRSWIPSCSVRRT